MLKLSHTLAAIASVGILFSAQPGFAAGNPPVVTCMSAVLSSTTVLVKGKATDADNDLTKVEVMFDHNGVWLPVNGTSQWSISQDGFDYRQHTVEARASDAAGNVSSPAPVVFPPTDSRSHPTITCITTTVNGSSVTIAGNAGGTSEVLVEFDSNGTVLKANGVTDWTITKDNLGVGSHSVTLTAKDYFHPQDPAARVVVDFTITAPLCTSTIANNVAHVAAGRATRSGFYAYAKGSNAMMGYYSYFIQTKLSERPSGYFVVGNCPYVIPN